jgi:DNA-binding XRE family transcriptional regulator
MVRSRGESPPLGDANLLPASLPEMGRSLRLAREQADLTLSQAADRVGLRSSAVEALESGDVGPQHDRIETLRTLKTYATSLGLPGNDYVLVAVEQWPAGGAPLTHGDTAVVPVVSISSAPAGGHFPSGGPGVRWRRDATGVADATTTGVFDAIHPFHLHDTGQISVVDTGQVPAVRLPAPRILKVLVGLVAFLIVVGGVGLLEHDHIDGWAHEVRSSTAHWFDNAKVALGIDSKPKAHAATKAASGSSSAATGTQATHAAPYKVVPDPSGQAATFNVAARSFIVRITAVNAPCWVQAVKAGDSRAVFEQVLPAGQSQNFAVTSSMTIETGSAAGHATIYNGFKLVGSYAPAKTPFTMTFNAGS